MSSWGNQVAGDDVKNSLSKVLSILEKKTPLHLAESWDNVGLLVEPPDMKMIYSILFTNDLTETVVDEAILKNVSVIYSYHPPIFVPFKALTMEKWKSRIIMKCIQKNIAVFSPHTASDAVTEGVNDWLISCFEMETVRSIKPSACSADRIYKIECEITEDIIQHLSNIPTIKIDTKRLGDQITAEIKVKCQYLSEVLLQFSSYKNVEVKTCGLLPVADYGAGRISKLKLPLTIQETVSIVKRHLHLNHLRISFGKDHSLETPIKSIAVCAGSGASVLQGAAADLYITGEMSHHELLDAKHHNITVILCEHSNTERGYLKQLTEDLTSELKDIELIISEKDKDPIEII